MARDLSAIYIPAFRYILHLTGFKKPVRCKDATKIRAKGKAFGILGNLK